jgi:branched-chain amino acid transport system permease protein
MKWTQFVWLGAVAGTLWGMNYFLDENLNPYYLRVLINCGIALILALSLNLVNGCAGQFSLGHAGFMGVGAYTSATLTSVITFLPFFQTNLGVGVAIVIGGLVAGLAGYLVGLPSLRLKGDYLAIVTLGFGEIIRIVFLNIDALGGARGLPGIPRSSNFFWVYLWVVLTFVFLLRLIRSSVGRAILSVRENEIAAEAMGINISHYKIVAFVISSFFAGIAGGLFAHYQGFIDPQTFNFNRSVEVVIMVVLGGMGSFSGAMIGGVIVSVLPEMLRMFDKYRLVIFPALLIVMMLVNPRGILGHREIWNLGFFSRKKKDSMNRRGALKRVETTA